uniref:Rab-GAP TBC domain-containing protein n=2 Tax=Mesocestoides corti TaxID=53468 RepID=A0A5K3FI19_MESCO
MVLAEASNTQTPTSKSYFRHHPYFFSEFLPPIDVLRAREMKWLMMCRNWDYWSSTGLKKLRERCRKGIPDSMRGEAWQRLVGSAVTKYRQAGIYVAESVEEPQVVPASRKFFRSASRLSGSRSLPTVVANSPKTSRNPILDSPFFHVLKLLYQRHKDPVPAMPTALPPPVAPSPSTYRDALSRRKSSSTHFKSFRKFGSLFRLNSTKLADPPNPPQQQTGEVGD